MIKIKSYLIKEYKQLIKMRLILYVIFFMGISMTLSAQWVSGRYYLDAINSTKDTLRFQKESTLTRANLTVTTWGFYNGRLTKTETMYYTYPEYSFNSTETTSTLFYKIDKENKSILIWYKKKNFKKSKDPVAKYYIIQSHPLIIVK